MAAPTARASFTNPRAAWSDNAAYDAQAGKLAALFQGNIGNFDVSDAIIAAGPEVD